MGEDEQKVSFPWSICAVLRRIVLSAFQLNPLIFSSLITSHLITLHLMLCGRGSSRSFIKRRPISVTEAGTHVNPS